MGFSIINHPFFGYPHGYGNLHAPEFVEGSVRPGHQNQPRGWDIQTSGQQKMGGTPGNTKEKKLLEMLYGEQVEKGEPNKSVPYSNGHCSVISIQGGLVIR